MQTLWNPAIMTRFPTVVLSRRFTERWQALSEWRTDLVVARKYIVCSIASRSDKDDPLKTSVGVIPLKPVTFTEQGKGLEETSKILFQLSSI